MATREELAAALTQQQAQFNALLQLFSKQVPNQAVTAPKLPDVEVFEDDSSKPDAFSQWEKRFSFSMDVSAPNLPDAEKAKFLLTRLSASSFQEYSRSCLPAEVTAFDYATTVRRLQELFSTGQSIWLNRYDCLRSVRQEGEDFKTFINRLKSQIRDFKFTTLNEQQFNCLVLLSSLRSPKEASLRMRILSRLNEDGDNVRFDAVITDLQNFITTSTEVRQLEKDVVRVNAIHNSGSKAKHQQKLQINRNFSTPKQNPISEVPKTNCHRCDQLHWSWNCPFANHTCKKCSRMGHLESQCEMIKAWKAAKNNNKDKRRIGALQIPAFMVNSINSTNSFLKAQVIFNNHPISFFLDTCSEVNILDETTWEAAGRPQISKCLELGRTYDGRTSSFIGKGLATFQLKGEATNAFFYVAPRGSLNLLGAPTMELFGLLEPIRKSLLPTIDIQATQFSNLPFDIKNKIPKEPRLCTKATTHLELKAGATHVYRRPRPLPFSSHQRVEEKLDRSKPPAQTKDHVIAALATDYDTTILDEAIRQTPLTFSEIKSETYKDSILIQIIDFIKGRWPQTDKLDDDLIAFYRRRNELSIVNDCLMYADRVVVPSSLRRSILKQLHTGHPGKRRMKELARCYVYWPHIDSHVDTFVHSCRTCKANTKVGRSLRTTMDLLLPPTQGPDQRDNAKEAQFNRHHGVRARSFDINQNVYARQRPEQPWKSGHVTKVNGVIYTIKFDSGNSNRRFHANQLRAKQATEDGADDYDALATLADVFNVPLPPKAEVAAIDHHDDPGEPEVHPACAQPIGSPAQDPGRPRRERRAPRILEMNPNQQTYRH